MAASLLLCRPLQRVRTTVVLRASGRERHFLATKKAQSKGGAAPALKAKSASAPVAKTVAKPVAKAAATKASAKPAPAAASKPASKSASKPASKSPSSLIAKSGTKRPAAAASSKSSATKPAPAKPTSTKSASGKPDAKKSAGKKVEAKKPAATKPALAAKTSSAKGAATKPAATKVSPAAVKSAAAPAKSSPAAPAAKTSKTKALTIKPASGKAAIAKPVDAKSAIGAKGAKAAKGDPKGAKAKQDPSETPNVPKKGPIDLAQHKSVAAVAAAMLNARNDGTDFIMINGRRVRAISTKGITPAKKSKAAAAAIVVPPTDLQIKLIKTKLSKKELEEYRNLLLAKRRQLFAMLNGMEQEALRSPGGQLSNMPVHMADMGSDVYEQDFTLGMAEAERKILVEIDAALQRIEDKTFGVCQMSGKPISKARLDAKPWAKYTIEAERIIESNGTR